MQPMKRKVRAKNRPQKSKTLPFVLNGDFPESNENYTNALHDQSIVINPAEVGLVPSVFWVSPSVLFGDIVINFFQKKNNSNCRFPHKLFNGLQIVEQRPELYNFIGVKWLNNYVFKVDKYIFGRLLGITSYDGGLFHSQGNFPSHGFREVVGESELAGLGIDLSGIDFERVRVITHTNGFAKDVDETTISQLKWNNGNNNTF